MGLLGNVLGKLKSGLEKSRKSFIGGLRSMLTGRRLDAQLIAELESRLIQADVGVQATNRLIAKVRDDFNAGRIKSGDEVLGVLKQELKSIWPEQDRQLHFAPPGTGPTVIVVAGVNGAGKTTSIAKLCRLLRDDGRSVLLGACDTFRAGAVRQLEIWAERLDVELVKGQQGGDPAAVAFDAVQAGIARGVDVVILDTAGRLPTQQGLMTQLTKITAVASKKIEGAPHEVLLVIDATAGQNGVRQAEAFAKSAGVTGIFLAKLDGTARGGIVIAIHDQTSIPVKFVGLGETPEDAEPFDPDRFIEAMFAI
jgi:fused signal recognition particle receptor